MKIIISRKGFDSKNGGIASPIFPDGSLFPLPIPYKHSPTRFDEVSWQNNRKVSELINQLGNGRKNLPKPSDLCHLDPDLTRESIKRLSGWRPAFGQAGKDQKILADKDVGSGDIFLFFGLYRDVVDHGCGVWRYKKGSRPVHLLYGYLQVDRKLDINSRDAVALLSCFPWLKTHPHLNDLGRWTRNTLYLAKEKLEIPRTEMKAAGSGLFQFHEDLILTANERSASFWKLPKWCGPGKNSKFSGKNEERHLEKSDDGLILKTSGIWQELVIDTKHYPKAVNWASRLIGNCSQQE